MKHAYLLILTLVLSLSLCACGASEAAPETVPATTQATEPVTEETTVPTTEATEPPAIVCTRTETPNGTEISGEGVYIFFDNYRNLTVTLSNLEVKDHYTINLPDTEEGMSEHQWRIQFEGSPSVSLQTMSWAYDPGNPQDLKLTEMQTDIFYIYEMEGVQRSGVLAVFGPLGVSGVSVWLTHTEDSITWECTLPETFINMTWSEINAAKESGAEITTALLEFDLAKLDRFEVEIVNIPDYTYEMRSYIVQ